MNTSQPDVVLMLYEHLPAGFEEGIKDLETTDVSVATMRIPGGPYAGVELYLPAAVGLFVASSYFGGILRKIGEEHYAVLKTTAQRLWRRSSVFEFKAIGSAGKVSTGLKFSLAFAITGEILPRLRFKLVLKLDIDEAEALEAIPEFLDLIRAILEDRVGETDLKALLTYQPVGGTVLVTFDPVAKRIVPVNGMEL
jgi:hypothetical protein